MHWKRNSTDSNYQSGFTLIELTITLGLVVILMGLVIVRFDWGSPRQRAIAAARQLGNMLITYREKAIEEERLYALRLDTRNGEYEIYSPVEKNIPAIEKATPIKKVRLDTALSIKNVKIQDTSCNSPVVIFFTPKGVSSELFIEIVNAGGLSIVLKAGSVVNEITYHENQN